MPRLLSQDEFDKLCIEIHLHAQTCTHKVVGATHAQLMHIANGSADGITLHYSPHSHTLTVAGIIGENGRTMTVDQQHYTLHETYWSALQRAAEVR